MKRLLKCDEKLVDELLTFAESFERDGKGHRTPALMRRAARRISELSERKRYLAQARDQQEHSK